jgi:hypothetical protein
MNTNQEQRRYTIQLTRQQISLILLHLANERVRLRDRTDDSYDFMDRSLKNDIKDSEAITDSINEQLALGLASL